MDSINAVQNVADYLKAAFSSHNAIVFKSDINPDSVETATIPAIYTFTVPKTELQGSYPDKCPCLVLTKDEETQETSALGRFVIYKLTLSAVVCNTSIVEALKADKEANNIYRLRENDKTFSTGADADNIDTTDESLIIQSHLMMNQCIHFLRKANEQFSISIDKITPAAPDLSDYPYCISQIEMSLRYPFIDSTFSELY